MTSNNPQTREWQALSSDHHLAPFSDFTFCSLPKPTQTSQWFSSVDNNVRDVL